MKACPPWSGRGGAQQAPKRSAENGFEVRVRLAPPTAGSPSKMPRPFTRTSNILRPRKSFGDVGQVVHGRLLRLSEDPLGRTVEKVEQDCCAGRDRREQHEELSVIEMAPKSSDLTGRKASGEDGEI